MQTRKTKGNLGIFILGFGGKQIITLFPVLYNYYRQSKKTKHEGKYYTVIF